MTPTIAVPAKAGTHRSADEAVDTWVPAFAGKGTFMVMET